MAAKNIMAEKRMFSNKIVVSDAFLEMPLSAQCLYFHLNMQADDEGFLNSPKKVMRIIGSNEDDLRILIAKNFVLVFESGVIVIKHWRINNYLRKDRSNKTNFIEERNSIFIKENGSYTFDKKQEKLGCQPTDNQMSTIGIPRLDKISNNNVHFVHDTSLDIDESNDVQDLKNNSNVKNKLDQDIQEVISYLNKLKGSSFRLSDSSTKHIKARMKDGYSLDQCKSVIYAKVNEWKDNDLMSKYLRPKTLFSKENFENYLQELKPIKPTFEANSEKVVVYDPVTGEEVIL